MRGGGCAVRGGGFGVRGGGCAVRCGGFGVRGGDFGVLDFFDCFEVSGCSTNYNFLVLQIQFLITGKTLSNVLKKISSNIETGLSFTGNTEVNVL